MIDHQSRSNTEKSNKRIRSISDDAKLAENFVIEWLLNRNLVAERYSTMEMNSGKKTPDFRVLSGVKLVAHCEVKSLIAKCPPGLTLDNPGAELDETTLNRITNDVHDACKKFRDVNARHEHPNILAFVNFDTDMDQIDLSDAILGTRYLDSGNDLPFFLKYAMGRIKTEKMLIDCYVWLDRAWMDGKEYIRFFGESAEYRQAICKLFELDLSRISSVGYS